MFFTSGQPNSQFYEWILYKALVNYVLTINKATCDILVYLNLIMLCSLKYFKRHSLKTQESRIVVMCRKEANVNVNLNQQNQCT